MIASLSSVRQAWCADSEFKITLDTMDFGHTVGEVELQQQAIFVGLTQEAIFVGLTQEAIFVGLT